MSAKPWPITDESIDVAYRCWRDAETHFGLAAESAPDEEMRVVLLLSVVLAALVAADESHQYCILGAGLGGLQMATFLQQVRVLVSGIHHSEA